jgi:fido (protein-threonine AMPylation protein)
MAGPEELLAKSLGLLEAVHRRGQYVLAARDLGATDRRRLVRTGYLQPIIKGWYLTSRPGDRDGETTAWQAYWREFVGRYARQRFGDGWYLSPELSLAEHTSAPLPSKQVAIHSRKAGNNVLGLPHGWSLFDYQSPSPAPASEVQNKSGLNVLSLPYALTQVAESFFRNQKVIAELAVGLLPDVSDIGRILLDQGKPVVAARLAGALRAAGRSADADELRKVMEASGVYRIEESNPFETTPIMVDLVHRRSPYLARIAAMWAEMREPVVDLFDPPPGLPRSTRAYLADVEERYVADAYNSLSIEGYSVTPDLIERVRSGKWNPDSPADRESRDAMAAKGYWLAHNAVKHSLKEILMGANAGMIARRDHRDWYRALWEPSLNAGIVRAADLAGYRNHPVFIRNADHVPPPAEAVRDIMPELFRLLEEEEHAGARAVLGHFVFVFIHPYRDGNGRLARFLMNAMLASGGYCWTVLPMEKRAAYFAALNEASARSNIKPFAQFVAAEVREQATARPKRKKKAARTRRPFE